MSLMDYAPWLVAGLAVMVAVVLGMRGRRRSPGGYPSRGHGHPSPSQWEPGAGLQDQLLRKVLEEVQRSSQKQAEQMQEVRTTWSTNIDRLEKKIEELSRKAGPGRPASAGPSLLPAPARPAEPEYRVAEYGMPTVTLDEPARPEMDRTHILAPVPGWAPAAGDRAVEIRDGVLVASQSLPPAAYVVAEGGGRSQLYLNPENTLNEFAVPKWQAFFDISGARAYAAYRTSRPAEVQWDEAAGRGTLVRKGAAEAL